MTDYIRFYSHDDDFERDYWGDDYVEPWVSFNSERQEVNYNRTEWEKKTRTLCTFEVKGDGAFRWVSEIAASSLTISYRKNGGEWTSITSSTGNSAPSIPVVSGDVVEFRGDNAQYTNSNSDYLGTFSGSTCIFDAKGNIMSFLDSTNFSGKTTLDSGFTFMGLFAYCTGLTDASELLLPATAMTQRCYKHMFLACRSLTGAPEIYAEKFAFQCFHNMFRNCVSLTKAPSSVGTSNTAVATNNCCGEMFRGCTSLVVAPLLPAYHLEGAAYEYMFSGCTNLNYVNCQAAESDISSDVISFSWLAGVSSTGTFVKKAGTSWRSGVDGIPTGWTVEEV